MKTYLTQHQLGALVHLAQTLRQWFLLGWGPPVHRVGNICLYDLDAVLAWEGGVQ